jgi:hypothetical protein
MGAILYFQIQERNQRRDFADRFVVCGIFEKLDDTRTNKAVAGEIYFFFERGFLTGSFSGLCTSPFLMA